MRFGLLLLTALVAAQATPQYRIEAFAGSEYAGDGWAAVRAPLVQPEGIARDLDGSIVVADAGDHRIRRISPAGTISTLVGDGIAGFAGDDGPASLARVRTPYGIAIGPNREVYVADLGNGRVRRISVDGSIQTIAGGGSEIPSAAALINAKNAKLDQPRNLAVTSDGILYISDFGANRVYRMTPDGMLAVIAGGGDAGDPSDGAPADKARLNGPAAIAVDALGTLYLADSGNQRVVAIWNNQLRGVLRDLGPVTSLTLDPGGSLYVAGGDRIAVVSSAGELSFINTPAEEVAADGPESLLTVAFRQVRSLRSGQTAILAGTSFGSYAGDGSPKQQWRFQHPTSIARDQSNFLYIADSGNGRIRRIDPQGVLSTSVAGVGHPSYFAFDTSDRLHFSDSKTGLIHRIERNGTLGLLSSGTLTKPFNKPSGIAFHPSGDLYVADTGNGLIRKVTPDGFVSTVAGGGNAPDDGFGLYVELKSPAGLAIGSDGSIWFTEPTRLRCLRPDGRVVTTAGLPLLDARGLHFSAMDKLILADAGENRILEVTTDGKWSVLAGSKERGHAGDGGPALQALLDSPTDAVLEPDGTILVVDSGNNRIRRLSPAQDAPAADVALRVRVFHAGTALEGPVAPGQIILIEADQPFTAGTPQITLGDQVAQVVSVNANRVTAVIPAATPPGPAVLRVSTGSGASGEAALEIAGAAPYFMGAVENADMSPNTRDNATGRNSAITLYVTGEGTSSVPGVLAEVAGIEVGIVSAERSSARPGQFAVVIQLPGGYLPSGLLPISLWIDGVKVGGAASVFVR